MLVLVQQLIDLADNAPCVTISLDLKFIGASKVGDEIIGNVKILKKTKTLSFLIL